MNWYRWDFGYFSRTIGLLILFWGFVLGVWNVWALPQFIPAEYAARSAMKEVLTYLFWGLTVLLVAEVAIRLHPRAGDRLEEPDADLQQEPEWPYLAASGWLRNVTLLRSARAGGALIIIAGTFLSSWEAVNVTDGNGMSVAVHAFVSGSLRYLFNGFVIVILAELAGRLRRSAGETDTPRSKQEIQLEQAGGEVSL